MLNYYINISSHVCLKCNKEHTLQNLETYDSPFTTVKDINISGPRARQPPLDKIRVSWRLQFLGPF